MPKIKIQIEADDDEFELEDIENFLNDLQKQFLEDADVNGSSPWEISFVNKNGTVTPLVSQDEEMEDEDEDEDSEEYYDGFGGEDDDE